MAPRRSNAPFVDSSALPFDLYKPLLSWIFQRPEFRQWLLPNCGWQLRLVGGPGSGKTTLSVLTAQHLQDTFPGSNACVVSLFFTSTTSLDDQALSYHVLEAIRRQLVESIDAEASSATSSQVEFLPDVPAPLKLEDLRKAVATTLSQTGRTFLVLDDVDLCNQSQWTAIEVELAHLRHHGMNIMTTSRLSLWHKYSTAFCDNADMPPEHGQIPVHLFWYCTCQGSIEEALTLICQPCKDANYMCLDCDKITDFIEPYEYVGLSIQPSDAIMSEYVSYMLELTHGDLHLSSSASPKPPHSRLGRALIASEGAALQLRKKIMEDAEGNIAMAKLRLEAVDGATTIENVVRYGDRLPATIVSLFDTGIADIQTREPNIEELGLKAIVGVAYEFHERPFADLERWLRRQMKRDGDDQLQPQDLTVEEVLRAAAGLIFVDNRNDLPVRLYHEALGYYVAERYNEALFWMYTSTNTVDAEEFEKPKRMQTWHASRKNLTRADTWK